jgi:hypothetical protein
VGKEGGGPIYSAGCRTNAPQVITTSRRNPVQFPTSRKRRIGGDANKIQGHQAISRASFVGNAADKFLPLTSWSKTIEVQPRRAVQHDMTDLDHPSEVQ